MIYTDIFIASWCVENKILIYPEQINSEHFRIIIDNKGRKKIGKVVYTKPTLLDTDDPLDDKVKALKRMYFNHYTNNR